MVVSKHFPFALPRFPLRVEWVDCMHTTEVVPIPFLIYTARDHPPNENHRRNPCLAMWKSLNR